MLAGKRFLDELNGPPEVAPWLALSKLNVVMDRYFRHQER